MSQLHVYSRQFKTIIPSTSQEVAIEEFLTHLETHGCQVKSHHTSCIGGKMLLIVEAKVFEFH
jgi:hypothetical protein